MGVDKIIIIIIIIIIITIITTTTILTKTMTMMENPTIYSPIMMINSNNNKINFKESEKTF